MALLRCADHGDEFGVERAEDVDHPDVAEELERLRVGLLDGDGNRTDDFSHAGGYHVIGTKLDPLQV